MFSSVSPHIGYGRPHTCAKPTTLSLRCPRTSVPAQRSPREVCATAAPDQRYGDPGAWFVSGARREVQPVAGVSVVHPAWQCATQPLQRVRRGGGYYGLQHLYVAGCSVTFATLPSAFVGIRSDIFSAHPRLQSGSTQRGASSSPSGKLTQPPSFNLDENWPAWDAGYFEAPRVRENIHRHSSSRARNLEPFGVVTSSVTLQVTDIKP